MARDANRTSPAAAAAAGLPPPRCWPCSFGCVGSTRFRFFIDSGLGPFALLRLNLTLVWMAAADEADTSMFRAARSWAGITLRWACAEAERRSQNTHLMHTC